MTAMADTPRKVYDLTGCGPPAPAQECPQIGRVRSEAARKRQLIRWRRRREEQQRRLAEDVPEKALDFAYGFDGAAEGCSKRGPSPDDASAEGTLKPDDHGVESKEPSKRGCRPRPNQLGKAEHRKNTGPAAEEAPSSSSSSLPKPQRTLTANRGCAPPCRPWADIAEEAENEPDGAPAAMRFEGALNKDGIKEVVQYDERDGKLYKITRHVRVTSKSCSKPKNIAKFGKALTVSDPMSVHAQAVYSEDVDFRFSEALPSRTSVDADLDRFYLDSVLHGEKLCIVHRDLSDPMKVHIPSLM